MKMLLRNLIFLIGIPVLILTTVNCNQPSGSGAMKEKDTAAKIADIRIKRILPPVEKSNREKKSIDERDLLRVYINFQDEIKIFGRPGIIEIGELRNIAKRFIRGKRVREDLDGGATMVEKDFSHCGIKMMIADQHVIRLINDQGTSYEKYLQVINELTAAYRELRDSFVVANNLANSFYELENAGQRKEIMEEIFPVKISEADPVNTAEQQ